MLYENEVTIIFNLVNSKTGKILGESLTPHILRIPKNLVEGLNVDLFLETYEPLKEYVREACQSWEDWEAGRVEYYNIQEDLFENVIVKDIIDPPSALQTYAESRIIEYASQCMQRFNLLLPESAGSFSDDFEKIQKSLDARKISKQSLNLYITSQAEETLDSAVVEEIKRILEE